MIKEKNGHVDMNRNLYQDIKRYDRNTMQNYLDSVYEAGFQKGLQNVPRQDLKEYIGKVTFELLGIKGIGEKKAAEITAVMIKVANGGNEDGTKSCD